MPEAKTKAAEVLSPTAELMTFQDFSETFLINSLAQRQPGEAYKQAYELYNAIVKAPDLSDPKKAFLLRCISANSGKPCAPHTLRSLSDGLWKALGR